MMSSNTQKLVTKLTKSVYIKTLLCFKIMETYTLSYITALIKYVITFRIERTKMYNEKINSIKKISFKFNRCSNLELYSTVEHHSVLEVLHCVQVANDVYHQMSI